MRSFPEEDNDGHLSQIVEQLCDLLDSDEGIFSEIYSKKRIN